MDSVTREFAKLLSGQDAAARQSLLQQANALAMNQADPESFEAPIRSLGDYLADPIEVPPVLVTPNLLVRGSVNCTLGRAGKGKTSMNLNRLIRWSTGSPVFSTLKNKDGEHLMAPSHDLKTLIVENEGAAGMFHKHIGLMLNAPDVLSPEEREAARENVLIWGDGGYSNLKLDEQQHMDWVRAGLERWSPDVMYIEPFRGLWSGEENSSTDMAVVVDNLSNLAKDYECAVLIAHHERKAGVGEDGEKMSAGRGSTVLEGAVATMENHESAVGGDYRELTWSKIRYAETEWPAPVRLQWDMEKRWYRHVPLAETEQKVMEVLVDEDEALTVKDVAQQTGETERKVRETLKALEEGKRVKAMKSVSDGFGSSGKRYRIPTSDNEPTQKGLDL